MPARLKLILAYDGTAFAGWQSQSHHRTVQDRLEQALRQISGEKSSVHGAGRTDAGVHALGQCAHVDVPDRRLSANQWQRALNANLPATIRILSANYVSPSFHARYSAKAKIYRYRIWNAPVMPPLEVNRSWHILKKLEPSKMENTIRLFCGEHDFRAFAANRGKAEENTVRTIHSGRIIGRGRLVVVEWDGNGFLYKMVRLMVGALVNVALGKLTAAAVECALDSGEPAGSRVVAPAEGLYLVRVRY
jgi:tRNA pseudouridine38-40 synthase